MSEAQPQKTSTAADLRKHVRRDEEGRLTLFVEEQGLAGQVSNISEGGVMFLSGESLRITVELEQEGQRSIRSGRLVRVQRMNADDTAYAVEFDAE